MEKKLGFYLCTGCFIGERVNPEPLLNLAKNSLRVPVVRSHGHLCSREGGELIREDIRQQGVNSVIIGGCSSRVKPEVFHFPEAAVERVPLRELAVWTQEPLSEAAQQAAEDYIRMGIIKAQKADPVEPYHLEVTKTLLVIGGGMAGMTAALEGARAGYPVLLVEKEPRLGGFLRQLYKRVPTGEFQQAVMADTGVEELIRQVEDHPRIQVLLASRVAKTEGQPGAFQVTVEGLEETRTFPVGAIVLAAGGEPYPAARLEHLGYGRFPEVVTNRELEALAKTGRICRPSDGKEAKRVVFIQCAGSRDVKHLPYCSAMCCATSLKQARYVRQNPEAIAMILYKDMRTPGYLEFFYQEAQNDPGVMLLKGEVKEVRAGEPGNLLVIMEDTLWGERVQVEADLVVLATGMVPATVEDPILNLAYRQGPGLPDLDLYQGFADSNFICFQYETRRTGIYAAGSVRQPMNLAEARQDAAGAALKAIQCLEQVERGLAVHPRTWDQTYPEPYMQRCTSCKRCTEECPFGAIDEDEKGTPYYKPARCRRCATCMGACPERIVAFKDYHVDMIGSMMKSVSVPDDEEQPRIIVLVCENDAYPALDTAAGRGLTLNPAVRFIPLRCLGSTNLVWVADAFPRGIDGMLLLGCKYGDNYQCHFTKGNELANYRLGKVQETLNRLMLEADRVQLVQVAIDEAAKLPGIIDDFVERVKEIGPNPYKGF